MKLSFLTCAFALVAVAACSTTTTTTTQNKPADNGETPGDEKDPDDPANQPPHSLGTISLGESHAAGSGKSAPIVSVAFVPDAMKARLCKKKLDASCEIVETPKCTAEPDSVTGCGEAEACVFDDACKATCKKIAVCSMDCEEEEVCTLDKKGKAVCAKKETFDAGPIAFSGTTTPITLFPPYAYETDGKGAPFLAGAEIKVQAQGATGAGFEKFEETFTATTFLQTTPALNKIPREKVFGTGALPIAWAPGEDKILVTVSGPGGAVTCKANDADGKFDLPRAAITAAIGEDEGTPVLSLSVMRQRKETKKDKVAKGELTSIEVQPEGWVDLITMSTESTSFQGCSNGGSICGSECFDLKNDPDNCGACGKACGSGQACGGGKCVDPAAACNACIDSQKTSTSCKSSWNACAANSECAALWSCISACADQTCASNCVSAHPDGQSDAQTFVNCAQNACSQACEGG